MDKIILIGGGGHAKVLIDLIKTSKKYGITGILDSLLKPGSNVSGCPVLGDDGLLPGLYAKKVKNACIAVGSVRDNNKRKLIYKKVKRMGFSVPLLVHPKAIVAKDARISEGVQIMAGAIIQTGSSIGENTIVNTGAIVEHDCTVGSHTHICPGSVISGGCFIGEGAFVGAGARLIHGIRIGKNSTVAAGAVVINNVPDNTKVMGVPAK